MTAQSQTPEAKHARYLREADIYQLYGLFRREVNRRDNERRNRRLNLDWSNADAVRAYNREYEKRPSRRRRQRTRNRAKAIIYHHRWKLRNVAYYQRPQVRIDHAVRVAIRRALRGERKMMPTTRIIGCSFDHLRSHLESQFRDGMTWANYGKWHIDHIVPVSYFDLTDARQLHIAFNWQNLRPLWGADNCREQNHRGVCQLPMPLTVSL